MILEVDFRALGLLISKYRYNANLSQEKLAGMIGVSTNFLGNIERGEKHPSVPTLFNICVALNLPPNELLNASVAQPACEDETHRLRDSAQGYLHSLSSILLQEENPETARFGFLEIGDEYGFVWKE